MTKEQFIEKIAPIIVKYAPQYNILCPSAVISQSVLESNGGMSELAVNAHNYFGLKYRPNRCPTASGIYYKEGAEQNPDGSYTTSAMQWMKFSNMDNGVRGYFDFTNISTYKSIKGISDPKIYLENIKKAGYATSLKYVENLLNVINKYDLTRFDKKENNKEVIPLGNNITSSTFLNETIHGIRINISLKCNSTNYQTVSSRKVQYIVIHYTGNSKDLAVNNAKYFQGTNRKASAHFFVDNTSIYQSVDLKNVAWHCGASSYKHPTCRNINSIGIEMCCTDGNYTVSKKTQENTAYLCARLCKLLGISANEVDTYVLTHHAVTGKNCPRQYANDPQQFVSFKNMVKDILNKGVISNSSSVTSSPSESSSTNTYTVVSGDTLSKIGSKTGIAWKTIADLNGIKSPYIIKVGQVLKLSNSNTPIVSYPTAYVHQGIDYSLVFNPTYYANKYSDLKKAFGTDSKKLFSHFCQYGMKEGRNGSATFNVQAYKNRYADLQKAFGNDLKQYYIHYLKYGNKEGRRAT